ncbi:helix-turn-helix transcriptional regulator [Bdellovibrionota bacterium FG-2]
MGRQRNDNYRDRALLELLKGLAANVKKIRERKKMSQQTLASAAKLSISTVWELEKGRSPDVRLSTVTALARVLEVDDPLKLLKRTN